MTESQRHKGDALWYLGYGANMNPKSLSEQRKVYPFQSIPCTVPNYELCFTVPGMTFMEPAFGSIRRKTDGSDAFLLHGMSHKVTKEDFAQIRRTEGGGGHEGK